MESDFVLYGQLLPLVVRFLTVHIILPLQGMLESIGFEVIAASPHDHPFSDGFAMPGGETYNIDDFTEVDDVQVSSSEHPRALGILARRL